MLQVIGSKIIVNSCQEFHVSCHFLSGQSTRKMDKTVSRSEGFNLLSLKYSFTLIKKTNENKLRVLFLEYFHNIFCELIMKFCGFALKTKVYCH